DLPPLGGRHERVLHRERRREAGARTVLLPALIFPRGALHRPHPSSPSPPGAQIMNTPSSVAPATSAAGPRPGSVRGWRATIAAGSIIALATSLTLWQEYFGFSNWVVGLVAALSANAFGAAIGALIGGPLGDRYGRKFIYTYDLILYMLGTLIVVFAVQPAMLVIGVILTGIAVGAGVPVAWTYIAEQAPHANRARHVGTAQLAWSLGPAIVFA